MSPVGEPLRVVRLFGDLLGTYGDDGNAVVLAQRARWRGHDATIIDVTNGAAVPDDGDVYVIGGGEDGPQTAAAQQLAASGALHRAVARGAAVLAVCAGLQILGRSFLGPSGTITEGLGLLPCETGRKPGPRRVGEVVATPDPSLGLPIITGYENHAGTTVLDPDATPLARLTVGHGNGVGDGTEGVVAGRIVATYLHGPVLARNPALADLLLAWALGSDPGQLDPLDDAVVDELRSERIAAAQGRHDRPGARSGTGATKRRRA
jgi:CobQ-like glutamine amidotransferase family enzyme